MAEVAALCRAPVRDAALRTVRVRYTTAAVTAIIGPIVLHPAREPLWHGATDEIAERVGAARASSIFAAGRRAALVAAIRVGDRASTIAAVACTNTPCLTGYAWSLEVGAAAKDRSATLIVAHLTGRRLVAHCGRAALVAAIRIVGSAAAVALAVSKT